MSKAGKGDSVDTGAVGSQHPVPENIPHLTSPVGAANGIGSMLHAHQLHHPGMQAGSPVKESSFLNRETSAEDIESGANDQQQSGDASEATSAPAAGGQQEIPVRR